MPPAPPPSTIPPALRGPPGPRKLYTLVVVHTTPDHDLCARTVLLGKKLRGFGTGYWNGYGGKVEPGESVPAAAARELKEEAGVGAVDLRRRGILTFVWVDEPAAPAWEVHVFGAHALDGEPVATEEMEPGWFSDVRLDEGGKVTGLPFTSMWADDPLWYPLMLADDEPCFMGAFEFRNTTELVGGEVGRVDALPPLPEAVAAARGA
jgi:8-oxo-dGTP diphosphatase